MKQPLIILTGPTAVGKTELSLALAKAVNGEIISADSMQVYKYMDIGTAKIRPEEMQGIPHYLVDEFLPEEDFNVVRFSQLAKYYMSQIYAKGKIPILVGGTGFYIQSVLYDIDFTENEEDKTFRRKLEDIAREQGEAILYERLKKVDPASAEAIHPNNIKRVIRALEYYEQTGEPISAHNEKERKKRSPYNAAYFVLTNDRALLYERINERVDKMLENGLVQEVEGLLKRGYNKEMVSMQGLGYKEIIDYLEGRLTLEEAVYILKRDTRHFAKRQITWFKREKEVIWLDKSKYTSEEELLSAILGQLKIQGIWPRKEKRG